MTPEQREELKKAAQNATRGPWMRLFGERTVYDRMEDGCRGNPIVRADLGYSQQDTMNLDFIAAANPAAILSLIAQVEALTVPHGWKQISHTVSPGGPIMAAITTVFKRGSYILTYEGGMGGETWKLDRPTIPAIPGTKEGA